MEFQCYLLYYKYKEKLRTIIDFRNLIIVQIEK